MVIKFSVFSHFIPFFRKENLFIDMTRDKNDYSEILDVTKFQFILYKNIGINV